ncbi:uncharacterized protein LOC129590202 isoform X2 [Paramacrobiotus metropolitanus]|uniref:uncharacterized protein LOC129590202 isoform X2 n=1 Tax=Paramacrobiotus metropolitanus TaxID=2943436 RepID=UPI00244620AB|nr:uncharacterized protein LOC129590202 isoform X2 [Paramacrobiotus metropolitanus]
MNDNFSDVFQLLISRFFPSIALLWSFELDQALTMFNVLDRLRTLRSEEPLKYQRICSRLLEIQGTGQTRDINDEGSSRDHIERTIEIRKATDDFFSRLATIDRTNEHFWKTIGNRWYGQAEESDLPQSEHSISRKGKAKRRRGQEQLIRSILLSTHPPETLRLILEHNHPQRVLKKLLLNRNKRSVLYGIRMKYGLPLPAYLIPKQEFQTRGNIQTSASDEDRVRIRKRQRKSRQSSSSEGRRRSSVVEELLTIAPDPPASVSMQQLTEELYYPNKDRKRRRSSRGRRHSRGGRYSAERNVSDENEPSENDVLNPFGLNDDFLPDVSETISEDNGKNQLSKSKSAADTLKVDFENQDMPAQGRTSSTAVLEDTSGGMDQYRLQRLKIIFEESDTDDEPGLDINEFKQAMKKIIGESVPEREIELIFMKVDANCDGNVDWNEFLEYTLREFQERDLMTQLTRDAFFEKHPTVIPGSRNQREIRAVVYASPHGTSRAARDLGNGRYFSMNREGEVICWSTEFKKIARHDLIPDIRGRNVYIRANDMCVMPEIKTLVVSLTTGDVEFYAYDDNKLELYFRISSLKSPVLCMHYHYQENDSLLLLGDQAGMVVACSEDPQYSMAVIPLGKQREPTYFSQKYGFSCFDYSDFLNVIATGSKNRSVQVWNPDNPLTSTMHFDGHEAGVDKVVVCRDADFLVAISLDSNQTVKVWDFKDQSCLQTFSAKDLTIPHYVGTFLTYNPMLEHLVYGSRDMLMLKRVDLHKQGPVDRFQKTHDEPIVAALYNDLFECIVTACQESTIMVWNFLTGDKIIQFRNAHTVVHNGNTVQVPIKSMCFDANQRRLLSCGSDGIIKIWNFNNGACLSSFDHLSGADLNVVRYQKNRDLVMSTGWNQYVFMVRDTRGEDEVDETVYEWEKIHRSDITVMEIIYSSDDVDLTLSKTASDEYLEPEIRPSSQASYIPSKIKRKSFEDLQFLDKEPEISSGHSTNGSNRQLPKVSKEEIFAVASVHDEEEQTEQNKETGASESGVEDISESDDSEASSAAERRKLSDDGSYAVTGSSDGELIVWHLFSGQPICCLNTDGNPLALSRMARNTHAGLLINDFPKVELKDSGSLETFLNLQTAQHTTPLRKNLMVSPDDAISIPKTALQSRTTVTAILILEKRPLNDGHTACLITASTDGFIRAWSIHHTNGGLKALFFAGHRIGSFVQTMTTDPENELLFTGDTNGYVKVWLLCEWAQSDKHLFHHRHGFDPRHFPFIKRHKFFSPVIAFRANHIMQQTVSTLPSSQRGYYQQPYLLNSYQAHLLRITQIQIVPGKSVIITGSADCSVRLWHFSGLYLGTLGQPLDFGHEVGRSSQTLPEITSTTDLDDENFLNEDEDPDEIVLKPKVIVPVDLAVRGSAVTLNVLHTTQHKRTIVPESALRELNESEPASGHDLHPRADYIAALGELQIKKQPTKDVPLEAVTYPSFRENEKGQEDLVFSHVPLKNIVHVGGLKDVVPEKLFQFNLGNTQAALLEKLPPDLKQPFLSLYKAGHLTGNALNDLAQLVITRENGLRVPRATNQLRLRVEKKVRLREGRRSRSTQNHEKTPTGKQRQPSGARPNTTSSATPHEKHTKGRGDRSSSQGTPEKSEHDREVPMRNYGIHASALKEGKVPAKKLLKVKSKWQKVVPLIRAVTLVKSTVSIESSEESMGLVTGRPSELNRTLLTRMRESEQEFVEPLANEQRRNAKFEYLDIVEHGGSDTEQARPYLPTIRRDADFYKELTQADAARILVTIGGKKKTIIKKVRSNASMDQIQRVYKMVDFGSGRKSDTKRGALGLMVPPEPRRLPSIIKGQINSSGKRSLAEIDLLAHEEDAGVKNQNIWGDQESLPIFQTKISTLSVHGKRKSIQHATRTEMLKEAGERLGYYIEKSPGLKSKVHRTTAAIVSRLKQRGGVFPKQRPFTNRYLYRQLSDSVLLPHDPYRKDDHSPPRTLEDYLRYELEQTVAQNAIKS